MTVTMGAFSVSLIIPTFNRAPMLAAALDAIAESNFDLASLEVIVVDDGSTDETSAIQLRKYPYLLRYSYQPNQGDALARNYGAKLSQGDLLVFLDDDITVTPCMIASLVEAHQGKEGAMAFGVLIPTYPSGLSDVKRPVEDCDYSLISEVPFTECRSGILMISHRDLVRLGMWQPLPIHGSSLWCDIELAYRAELAGFSFLRSSKAIAYHHDLSQRDLKTNSRRMRRVGKSAVLLFQRHPLLQQHLPMFLDKSKINWRKDRAPLIARKMARALASTILALMFFQGLFITLSALYYPSLLGNSLERWILGGYLYRGYREGLTEFGPVNPGC